MGENNVWFFWGGLVGIILVLCIALVQKWKNTGYQFDERQMQARGKAFQYGFFTLVIYDFFYAVLFEAEEPSWCNHTFGMLLGVMLSIIVWSAYAIFKDAYLGLREKPVGWSISFGLLGIFWILHWGLHQERSQKGKLGVEGFSLLLGITMLFIAAALITRQCMEKHMKE